MDSKAFTLIELTAVIAIVCLLAALAFPAYSRVRTAADNVRCVHNLTTLHQATMAYINDNDQYLPVAFNNTTLFSWSYVLISNNYLKATLISSKWYAPGLGCPVQRQMIHNTLAQTYGMNGGLCRDGVKRRVQTVTEPSKAMLLGDGNLLSNGTFNVGLYQGGSALPTATHGQRVNLIFLDGHAESWLVSDIPTNAWSGGPPAAMLFWNGVPQ